MRRLLPLFASLALAASARAASSDDLHWSGLPHDDRGFGLFVDLGYQHGEAPGARTYWRYDPRITLRLYDFGGRDRTTGGHPFGMEFDFAIGWLSHENSLTGPEVPSASIAIPFYMDLRYVALVRAFAAKDFALVAYAGPAFRFGAPEWTGGMMRFSLSTGLRAAYGKFIADFEVRPVDLRDDADTDLLEDGTLPAPLSTSALSRIDYRLSLLTRVGKEGILAGLRLGYTPMRDRGFFGHEWSLSLVGGL